jgi:ketosteroid isomerase-like protein
MVQDLAEAFMRPPRFMQHSTVVLALLVTAVGCRPQAGSVSLSAQDETGIRATLEAWKQAGLAGDWPTFFGQFTEDAVWIGPSGPPREGLAAIKADKWVPAREEELVPLQIDGRGDLAFARGKLSLLLPGQTTKREGTFLTILRKQSNGSWRMAVYSVVF